MISETFNKWAFDRRARTAHREPVAALQRGLSHPSQARCDVVLLAGGALASLVGLDLASDNKIYSTFVEECKVTYTDTPPSDADKTNRPDAVAPHMTSIVYPASESNIPTGLEDFLVDAEVFPSLDSGKQLILLLDGEAVSTPQSSPKWPLTNVFHCAHRLQVERVSEMGEIQSQSTEQTVHAMRATVNR